MSVPYYDYYDINTDKHPHIIRGHSLFAIIDDNKQHLYGLFHCEMIGDCISCDGQTKCKAIFKYSSDLRKLILFSYTKKQIQDNFNLSNKEINELMEDKTELSTCHIHSDYKIIRLYFSKEISEIISLYTCNCYTHH